MNDPLVSVIIPPPYTMNSLQSMIESITAQTCPSYEVIVVTDSGEGHEDLQTILYSHGSSILVLGQANNFGGSIFHAFNKSCGKFISILDCNDRFIPEKFDLHVEWFNKNPAIGGILSGSIYANSDKNYDSAGMTGPILDTVDHRKGESFSFSDGMFRREWFDKFFQDESLRNIESVPYLAISFHTFIFTYGCRMLEVNKVINFRLPRANGSSAQDLSAEETKNFIKNTFQNTSCILCSTKLSNELIALNYLNLSISTLEEHETDLGQQLLRNSIRLDRSILDSGARAYLMHLVKHAIREHLDIDTFLRNQVEQHPPEFAWITDYLNNAIGRGYFYKLVYNVIFDRINDFHKNMDQVEKYGFTLLDSDFIEMINILDKYETFFSSSALKLVNKRLSHLRQVIGSKNLHRLRGRWFIKRAFRYYSAREFSSVPKVIVAAFLVDPVHVCDRGVLSILIKSSYNVIRGIH